jgi:hypothetical protein
MTAADMGADRADVAERVRAAAFEDEDGRRIVHSFLGGLGADWDEDDVLAFIADERNVIGWVENILGHDLRVVEPVSGRRPRVYYFDVTRPPQPVVPEQAATDVDTSLEVALDGVLSRYGLPSYGYPHGGDRGDLASDLATAVREWLGVEIEVRRGHQRRTRDSAGTRGMAARQHAERLRRADQVRRRGGAGVLRVGGRGPSGRPRARHDDVHRGVEAARCSTGGRDPWMSGRWSSRRWRPDRGPAATAACLPASATGTAAAWPDARAAAARRGYASYTATS